MPRTPLSPGIIACALLLGAAPAPGADDAKDGAEPRHAMTRPAGRSDPRSAAGSGGFWLGSAGVALALAAFGALSLGARKWRPGGDPGPLKVVGRASLTPRQSVFLLRAGDRVFLLGAGGQGPPSLLGEFSDDELAAVAATAPNRRVDKPARVGGAA